MSQTKYLIFGDARIPLQPGMTIEQAKNMASMSIPGLADSEGHIDAEGNYVFTKRAGKKGVKGKTKAKPSVKAKKKK